jgi:hypothetical protein
MDAKSAAVIAKKYFEETKTHPYFLFETESALYKKGQWIIKCEVKNAFDNVTRNYIVIVDDDKGTIMDVKRLKGTSLNLNEMNEEMDVKTS